MAQVSETTIRRMESVIAALGARIEELEKIVASMGKQFAPIDPSLLRVCGICRGSGWVVVEKEKQSDVGFKPICGRR